MLDVDLEVVLVVGVMRRYFDYPGASLDSGDLLAWRGPPSILLGTTVVPLEVSRLAIVVASNAGLVLAWTEVPLVGVYVHRPLVVPVGRAGVLAFAAMVGLGVGRRERCTLLPLPLLPSFELPVVDRDGGVHIRIQRLRVSVGLNELVLDVVLEPVVEPSLEYVGSPVDPEYELPELRGILDS